MARKRVAHKSRKGDESPYQEQVPDLRGRSESSDVVAILCSDVHLSHKPPAYRSSEPDWYKAMRRPLKQLRDLCVEHDAPCIIAGDIFDRWNSPSELVNFAIKNLPKRCYAIPGQHDLSYHSYTDIKKTSYWTLVESGIVTNIPPESSVDVVGGKTPLRLWGFPWGFPVKPLEKHSNLALEVAVVHAYIWTKDTGHPTAKKEHLLKSYQRTLADYNAAVFGDNHTPFQEVSPCSQVFCSVLNCGTFMVRKSDDCLYPTVGLLHSDGSIVRTELNTRKDKYLDSATPTKKDDMDFKAFLDELAQLGDAAVNFSQAIYLALDGEEKDDIPKSVKNLILKCLERHK